jgi:hypothetical protein
MMKVNSMKNILVSVLTAALLAFAPTAQAQVSISNLPSATLPLAGTELSPLVQSGTTRKAPVSSFVNLATVPFVGLTFNKVTVTQPASGSTLTIANSKTLTVNNNPTIAGTDGTYSFQGTDTYVGRATTDTFTNKTYDTAGAGNSFSINGLAATANTGTGAVVRASALSSYLPLAGGTLTGGIGFSTTNTLDIGTSATVLAPRTVYAGTSFVGPTGTFTTAVTSPTLTLGTISSATGTLKLANASSANLTTIQAGNAANARTYTWPTNFGAAGSILTDVAGNGTLSWAGGGGGCSIIGSQYQIVAVNSAGTGCTPDANASVNAGALTLGASGTVGTVSLGNATTGTVTLGTVTGALGTVTASLPANAGVIAELNLAQSWTATQTHQTILAGTTNTYDIGTSATVAAFRTVYAGTSFVGPVGTFTTSVTTPTANLSGTSNQLVFQSAGVTGTLSWAPASTNKTITLPNGTTDFTGTGGTSQVVKQVSSGAAFTVGQLQCSDLSNAGTGCSGTIGNYLPLAGGTMTGALTNTVAAPQIVLGVNTTTLGAIKMFGNTSGDATIEPAAVAGTSTVITLPAATGTLATLAGSETLTNKTLDTSVGKGTWTASGTWTLPAYTLNGTVSGGGNQINNVVIGASSAGNGTFTQLTGTSGSVTGLTGLAIRDTSAAFDVTIAAVSNTVLTAGRVLTLNMQNVAHIFTLGTTANTGSGIIFPNTATDTVAVLGLADQTLSGGANVTSSSQGTKSSGTFTVDCGASPLQYIVNGGAFTLAAPANDGSCIVRSLNNGSAGAITFSGFTVGSNTGDALTTTNTNAFAIQIFRINGVSRYLVSAYQ